MELQEENSTDFEEFVYLLSHDVRGSVRALVEIPQWISEDLLEEGHALSASVSSNIRLMNTHTRRLDAMFTDLLTYSRVGRNQPVKRVPLKDAIIAAIAEVDAPQEFNISHDVDDVDILIGERDIMTLLVAILSNAIKHHHHQSGSVGLTCRNEHEACVILVEDDGPGIPEKDRERVFEVMTTLKSRDEVEGSGMGLAIVRKIVERYSGSIRFLSLQSQAGTALEIRIPYSPDRSR